MSSMNKKVVLTKDLFDCSSDFLREYFDNSTYPWELLPQIKEIIKKVLEQGLPGYTLLKEGVLVGENVSIAPTATIIPPAIIGNNTELRPGAYLRGNVIVGDSVLGNYAHMGAGSICSNLKSDGKNIVIHGDKDYETGLRKIGAILGDYADIGCQSVLNPGTVIGQHSQIYPLSMVRGVVPENSIYKAKDNIVVKEKR